MKNVLNKIKWVGGLLFVFLLILATNLLDRRHVKAVRTSVNTIYEDRLIVKNLIYSISTLTEEKRIAFLLSDSDFYASAKSKSINDSIFILINQFSKTKLTTKETQYLERLYDNFKEIEVMESQVVNTTSILQNEEWRNKMKTHLLRLRKNLNQLSEIQLDEGKRELSRVNRAFNTIDLFTNIEIMFLIAIGIVIQIIILYPKGKEK